MHYDAYICFKPVYSFRCMYVWLHMARYTYTCSIQAPKRCMRPFYIAFTPRKLVPDTRSQYSYGTAPISMQRAVAPAKLPRHMVIQLSRVLYKSLNKPNLSMCINRVSGESVVRVCPLQWHAMCWSHRSHRYTCSTYKQVLGNFLG